MSLNRYEQAIFDYWERQPDEKRHWQTKVAAATLGAGTAQEMERELWAYFEERSAQVPRLQDLRSSGARRVSLLNLAEYLLRLWGPPPMSKRREG